MYIFFARRDIRKLTCLTAKFQEEAFQFWSSEKMLLNKLSVDVLLLMLCTLHFCKSFQSDNYVYYDLNDSALDFLI